MTGFRFDSKRIKKRLAKFGQTCVAADFRPELETFVTKALKTASDTTPVRSKSLIEQNQHKQFAKRAEHIRLFPLSQTRSIGEAQFIKERAQARFLYRKSWMQCAESAGLNIRVSPAVSGAVTRRRPPVNPPRGYAQWRGGNGVLSLIIRNPFLNIPSKYKTFNPATILNAAIVKHRPEFLRYVRNHIRRSIYAASKL